MKILAAIFLLLFIFPQNGISQDEGIGYDGFNAIRAGDHKSKFIKGLQPIKVLGPDTVRSKFYLYKPAAPQQITIAGIRFDEAFLTFFNDEKLDSFHIFKEYVPATDSSKGPDPIDEFHKIKELLNTVLHSKGKMTNHSYKNTVLFRCTWKKNKRTVGLQIVYEITGFRKYNMSLGFN